MATLTELYDLTFSGNGTLLNKVIAACLVQAEVVRTEDADARNTDLSGACDDARFAD